MSTGRNVPGQPAPPLVYEHGMLEIKPLASWNDAQQEATTRETGYPLSVSRSPPEERWDSGSFTRPDYVAPPAEEVGGARCSVLDAAGS